MTASTTLKSASASSLGVTEGLVDLASRLSLVQMICLGSLVARSAVAFSASKARSEWSAILQTADDAFISNASSLEPGRDLHDFVIFADRTPASDASAGRLFGLLKANSVSIDRA